MIYIDKLQYAQLIAFRISFTMIAVGELRVNIFMQKGPVVCDYHRQLGNPNFLNKSVLFNYFSNVQSISK